MSKMGEYTMKANLNYDKLLSNYNYRKFKKHQKRYAFIFLPITALLLMLTVVSIGKSPITHIVFLMGGSVLCLYISFYYIKAGFIQKRPINSGEGIIKSIRKRRRTNYNSNAKIYWVEYLVEYSGKEVWAHDLVAYGIACSNYQLGDSVILFEDMPERYYIVINS